MEQANPQGLPTPESVLTQRLAPGERGLNPQAPKSPAEVFNWLPPSATPAVATDAVITLPAEAGYRHTLGGIVYSYTGGVPTGRLTVGDGRGGLILDIGITAAGPGQINFTIPQRLPRNVPLEVRLYSGGAAVTGRVAILGYALAE